MHFAESIEGPWRIYAGALESSLGDGYTAAVVVQPAGAGRELWRDDSLACGHRWPSAEAALRYALSKARQVIRELPVSGSAQPAG